MSIENQIVPNVNADTSSISTSVLPLQYIFRNADFGISDGASQPWFHNTQHSSIHQLNKSMDIGYFVEKATNIEMQKMQSFPLKHLSMWLSVSLRPGFMETSPDSIRTIVERYLQLLTSVRDVLTVLFDRDWEGDNRRSKIFSVPKLGFAYVA